MVLNPHLSLILQTLGWKTLTCWVLSLLLLCSGVPKLESLSLDCLDDSRWGGGGESGGGSKNSNLWPFFVWRTQWLVVICLHIEVKYWRWPPTWLAENSKDSLTPAAEIVVGFCSFGSGWGCTVGKLSFGCCMASLEDLRTCCTWILSLSPENDSLMSRRNLCPVNQDCAETH